MFISKPKNPAAYGVPVEPLEPINGYPPIAGFMPAPSIPKAF